MPLEIFFGEVLEVSLGKGHVCFDGDFLFVVIHLQEVSQFASFAVDFYALLEVLCEVGSVEDLILDGLGAVDGEVAGDFGLVAVLFGVFFDFGFFGNSLAGCLFCGHYNI